jgi:hypothetical protein
VKEKGGGLLFIAGPQFSPGAFRDTPLADVLPVEPPLRQFDDELDSRKSFRIRLTPIGQMHPLFRLAPEEAENQTVWERLMPLYWSAGPLKLKPAAEILAVRGAGDSSDGPSAQPLAVQQFVGAGRVLFFGFDESWRWRLRDNERLYKQFWMQTVNFLARPRLGRADLRLDKQAPYRQGEPIRVTVRFPDDAAPPNPETPVQVAIESKAENGELEVQNLQLARLAGSRGTYEALLSRSLPGSYRFRLVAPTSTGPAPETTARVLPPPGETDNLKLNRGDLERAALISRGRYYDLAEAGRLPAEMPEAPRVSLHQPRPPYELWSHPSMFLLGLGLIGIEWLLRKRRHLL